MKKGIGPYVYMLIISMSLTPLNAKSHAKRYRAIHTAQKSNKNLKK